MLKFYKLNTSQQKYYINIYPKLKVYFVKKVNLTETVTKNNKRFPEKQLLRVQVKTCLSKTKSVDLNQPKTLNTLRNNK